jgi:DNA invertase Pin-like site-specific DNA recombinase
MTKITPDHMARSAFVYIRQSTTDQVLNNHESRRRQYGLAERARQLGWQDVVVIDDDLGRSGSGVTRPGFERLLAAICEGRAGAVFAIEASRLARNGRDWHTLIEFCGLVGAIIIDEDGVYEPRHPNDRLLLGMKGTMSELELSILRQRSIEALKQKARRGELFMTVAVGYVKVRHDRIEKDPDQRVREALALVFPNSRSSRACARSTSGSDRNISPCRWFAIRRRTAAASPGVCLSTTRSTIFCIIRSMPAPMPSVGQEAG